MRKNDQRKSKKNGKSCGRICPAVLSLLILCSWMISSILVYGFDMSEMNSLDTGGFDMDVGEGTGQLPEDWEKSYGGTEKNDGNENREDENLMEDSSVWAGTENGQEDSARWSSDFQAEEVHSPEENSVGNGNTAAENSGGSEERYEFQEPDIRENENPGITIVNEANLTKAPVPTKSPVLTQTLAASPSAIPTPGLIRKPASGASKKAKDQNPALSYYQTEPTEMPDKEKKEQKPTIHTKTDGNRIQIEIRPDIPFQILSFRINGKECDFYWHGKKLLAELPEKTRKPWKAELLGFVKSGKLYYESMDLTEKQ